MELKAFVQGSWAEPPEFELSHLDIVASMAESFARLCAAEPPNLGPGFLNACRDMGLFELFDPSERPGPVYAGVLGAVAERFPEAGRYLASAHSANWVLGNETRNVLLAERSTLHESKAEVGQPFAATFCLDLAWGELEAVLVPASMDPENKQWVRLRPDRDRFTLVDPANRWEKTQQVRVECACLQALDLIQPKQNVDLRAKHGLDQLVLCQSQLKRGQALALDFTEHRILFKRKLRDFQLTQTRLVQMEASLCLAEATILNLAFRIQAGNELGDLDLIRAAALKKNLRLGSDLLQIFAGTGYMTESGMPSCYEWLLHYAEYYPGRLDLGDAALADYLGFLPETLELDQPEWPESALDATLLWRTYQNTQTTTRPGFGNHSAQLELACDAFALAMMGFTMKRLEEQEHDSLPRLKALAAFLAKTMIQGSWGAAPS